MSARTAWLLVVLACLVFAIQVAAMLRLRWVEDESWQSIPAGALITEGRIRNPTFQESDFEYEVSVKPVGHTLVLAPVFQAFGVGIVQARLPSLLSGLGVIVITYLIGSLLMSRAAGVVAAWLVMADNFVFLAGYTARPEIFVTLLSWGALLLHLLAQRRQSATLAALAGLAVGCSANFHVNGLAMGLAIGLLLLVEHRLRFWKQPRFWAFAAGAVLPLLVFWLWAHSTPAHAAAFAQTYGRAGGQTLAVRVAGEIYKWRSFLGYDNVRFPLPLPVPMRLHIGLAVVAAFVVLWQKQRQLAVLGLLVLLAHQLLWVNLLNHSMRYLAVLGPLFALAIAGAVVLLDHPGRRRVLLVAACLLLGLSQLAGNALVIWRSRPAEYATLQSGLRELVPPGRSVYGAITFWPALHDRTYYAYERMTFDYAIEKRRPEYLILNDRVMVKGMGFGLDDWAELREQANHFARQHGELVGRVLHPFYGDLEIWRVKYAPQ